MSINAKNLLTDPKRFFLEPSTSAQRQYEALRGFFIEELPSAEAAQRFGYTPGSFRVLVHDFRHDPAPQFFIAPQRGPDSAPKSDPLRERIITLRKQNFSIYDIRDLLREEGQDPTSHSQTQEAAHQVRRAFPLSASPRQDPSRGPPSPSGLPRVHEDPRGLRHAFSAGTQAVRQLQTQPCHELCLR